ncbi:peptidase [Pueribacillus theae]|uniref:Peptidase n=1 Tax=Pueribacillus theae TaxID=2171751 RepID=A0A2U1K598_9BACI|nr:peptidoglycan-binding protein [Pueribacillus theae]PWA12173.1 peptidase [Pueribacillus theae]
MLHINGKGLIKKITISATLAGAFTFASYIGDFEFNHNIASASQMNTNQILKVGSRGGDVKNLQSKLKVKADGIYGPATKNAVMKFQRSKKLSVDGIAGPQTLRALNGSKASATNASKQTKAVKSSTLLRNGSRGQAVKNLQSKLKNLNYLHSKVDGIYGSGTANAVRAFQRANGLAADGIAGPQTLRALNNGKAAKKSQSKSSGSTAKASNLVSTAKSVIGSKYKYGGTTPSGFDCSGFLNYVYKKNGVKVPRTVSQIRASSKRVSSPKAGDVVFFNTTGKGPSHAGIYLGNNQFIHSGSSTGVTISSLNNSYWKPRYIGAGSVL